MPELMATTAHFRSKQRDSQRLKKPNVHINSTGVRVCRKGPPPVVFNAARRIIVESAATPGERD